MRSDKNILIAFLLNIVFSIVEFAGGLFTSSIAIMSDAIHDFGDALSIGVSYFLERKSRIEPNEKYTYGYLRYSVLGAVITNIILLIGSVFVICSAVNRIIHPVSVDYNGMLFIALFGVIINFIAAYSTRDGNSLNQKSVNLHMMEDVLGWIVVLIGAILMKFTKIDVIDAILSILVALFIIVNAIKNMVEIIDLFLIKTPNSVDVSEIKKCILSIEGIENVHHIHIWSIDGINNFATLHIITNKDSVSIKKQVRKSLNKFNIEHITIEIENNDEVCDELVCNVCKKNKVSHKHHH